MRAPLLQVRHISKHYENSRGWLKKEVVHALKMVSFELHQATTIAVVGENGSGKSTLAHLLVGEIPPSSGEIILNGEDITTCNQIKRCMDIRLIPQNPSAALNPRQRVGKQILAPLSQYSALSEALRLQKLFSTMKDVGLLEEHADYYPNMLSASQRLRVTLARAMIVDPQILVFDQTLSAMDVTMRAQLVNLLTKLQQSRGVAYVMIAHQLSLLRHLADEVIVMQEGQVVEQAPTQRIFESPSKDYTKRLMYAYKELTEGSTG